MKNIFNKSLIVLMSIFLLSSCDKNDDVFYEGAPLLQFSKESGKQTVGVGDVSSEAIIEFGTQNVANSSNEVKLVFDAIKSTAVPGVDFTLVNGGVETLPSGVTYGQFKVKILESGANPVPKVAVFHLSSNTLVPASFNQEFTLTMSLKCSINYFLGANGDFNYDGYFLDPAQYQIIKDPVKPLTMRIVDFLDTGVDFVFRYDDDTRVITFDEQNTGQLYQGVTPITVMMPVGAVGDVGPSTLDACGRKAIINMRFAVGAQGSFGNHAEKFTGF